PATLGNLYVVKAHAGVSPLALSLIRAGKIKATYIYRDPRDALLSAYEYGRRKREAGRSGAFSELNTIEQAIYFMKEYVQISETWLACEQAFHTKYEDLLLGYGDETQRLLAFLDLDPEDGAIKSVIHQYQPTKGRSDQKGTHFVKGKVGRYREQLTVGEQDLCIQFFGPYLEKMGYPNP
ncbi:MAG: sulfotransferase domain-containing protein, partial [Anaerolineales bacterium]|nr:sulfotransferase domain-containing protein [Anaerolineales bacterium]